MRTDEDIIKSEAILSDAYLRLRAKLKWWGAYDTLLMGTDRFIKTEQALDTLIKALEDANYKLSKIQDITNE